MSLHSFSALTVAHDFLSRRIKPNSICIDATAGRGRDTLFLCNLVGPQGRVLAFDIQQEAIDSTKTLLDQEGFGDRATVILDSHVNMDSYASPESVSGIIFNFGWLPGGNHSVFTKPETSIQAIQKGLELLTPDGVMSLCIYYGKDTGFSEHDALLEYVKTIDPKRFSVIVCDFANRPNCPPIPVLITRDI